MWWRVTRGFNYAYWIRQLENAAERGFDAGAALFEKPVKATITKIESDGHFAGQYDMICWWRLENEPSRYYNEATIMRSKQIPNIDTILMPEIFYLCALPSPTMSPWQPSRAKN